MEKKPLRVAIVGAGWAGMAAAVSATLAGHQVSVFEAGRVPGGRARTVQAHLPDGTSLDIDNGQHILIGAYRETLALMRTVGVLPETVLHREPLNLSQPDGAGLALPDWPSPIDALAGIWGAMGWSFADRAGMTLAAIRWQLQRFTCAETTTVASLCAGLPASVMRGFIEPLCVSALNTPPDRASGRVFLTVLRDAMFGGKGSSNLLIPTVNLSALFPLAAARWLQARGANVHLGCRIAEIQHNEASASSPDNQAAWRLGGHYFDRVILASGPTETRRLLENHAAICLSHPAADTRNRTMSAERALEALQAWIALARKIQFESIATVYTMSPGARLPRPMIALLSDPLNPAQFVFDRGRLGGPTGLWAFVVSASTEPRELLQSMVLQQAHRQLSSHFFPGSGSSASAPTELMGLTEGQRLNPVITIVEKKATFACTPGLINPAHDLGRGLLACGDYLYAPYPATLEGAVRSGQLAAQQL